MFVTVLYSGSGTFRSHDTSAVTFLNPAEAKIQIYSIVRMPVKSHEFQ